MTTPSERIWQARDELDSDSGRDALVPSSKRAPETLAQAASRIRSGISLREAVADFLDDLRLARDAVDVSRRIEAEPVRVGRNADAYFAAIAEHVAWEHGITSPRWTRQPDRFLSEFWWPASVPALEARALAESPAAFRRRGIFIGATTLQRV